MKRGKNIRLNEFSKALERKKYRGETIRVYTSALKYYFSECRVMEKEPKNVKESFMILRDIASRNRLAPASYYRLERALRLYYNEEGNGETYAKSRVNLFTRKNEPLVYTREEIREIIDSSSNLRQKTLLSVAYACGLRLREISSLKISDVDAAKNLLKITGETTVRPVMLPEKVIRIIDEYKRIYKPRIWLFESEAGEKYSARSAESCFSKALRGSGIAKRGSFRNLRYSFALHMIESGTDIYLLQRIMGYNTKKPAHIFLRMTGVDISRVKSPIEDI